MLRGVPPRPSISATAVVNAITSCRVSLFDFENARRHRRRRAAQQRGVFGRNDAQFGQRFGRGQFHFEPLLKLVLIAPDGAHFAARITGNQYAKTSVASSVRRSRDAARGRAASSDCSAPMRTISGWLLCSLRCPRISVCTPLIEIVFEVVAGMRIRQMAVAAHHALLHAPGIRADSSAFPDRDSIRAAESARGADEL